jgi:hypothetical protein
MDQSIATLYPNPEEVLPAYDASVRAIDDTFLEIELFWEDQTTLFGAFLSQSPSASPIMIGKTDINSLADTWRDYRDALDDAIVSISSTNDAIMVNAVGAPRERDIRLEGTKIRALTQDQGYPLIADAPPVRHDQEGRSKRDRGGKVRDTLFGGISAASSGLFSRLTGGDRASH